MQLSQLLLLPFSLFFLGKGDMVFNFFDYAPTVQLAAQNPLPISFHEHKQIISYYKDVELEINRLIPQQLNHPAAISFIQNVEQNIVMDICMHANNSNCFDLSNAYRDLTILHKTLKKDAPEISPWKVKFDYTIKSTGPKILCIEEFVSYATDGYADMESTSYMMFNLENGEILFEEDIFKDIQAILPIVENAFKAYWLEKEGREISNYELEEISFPNNEFALPSAIGMTETDILFTYDRGEYMHDAYPAVRLAIPKSAFGENLLFQ